MSTAAHAPFGVSCLTGLLALFAASLTRVHHVRSRPTRRNASITHETSRASLCSVLRFSQPLDGFLRAPASQAYFILQPRLGFIPVQGLLPFFSRPSSSLGCFLHAVQTPFAHRPKPAAENKIRRLRGLAPKKDAFLQFGFTRAFGRSPHQVDAPPGVPPPAVTTVPCTQAFMMLTSLPSS